MGEGRRNAPRKGERTLPAPLSARARQSGRCRGRLALGGLWAQSLPLTPFPGAPGEEVPISAGLRLHVRRDGGPARRAGLGTAPGPGAGAAATAALRTSGGEVPQLFPANCFTYVLEKDMALSFRNHSSAQWVQQGANTCETPTEAAPSPFLKHFFLFAFRETDCRLI